MTWSLDVALHDARTAAIYGHSFELPDGAFVAALEVRVAAGVLLREPFTLDAATGYGCTWPGGHHHECLRPHADDEDAD